jgi:hypothetical protein
MRSETDFIALDGAMIAFAVLLLTVFHPGYCFPRLGATIGGMKNLLVEPGIWLWH